MRKTKLALLVAASTGSALLAVSPGAFALTEAERLERLEKTLQKLEQRLENSESENKALRQELSKSEHFAKAKGGKSSGHLTTEETGSTAAATALSGKPITQSEYKALDTKVKLLERKFEVEKEVTDTARKSAAKVDVGQNGFKIGTADGDWQLRLRGFIQADFAGFLNDNLPGNGTGVGWDNTLGTNGAPITYYPNGLAQDRFQITRARLQFAGTIAKYTDFLIAEDFGQGQARLFDAWADFHYYQPLSFAFGKMKGPQDLERLQTATNLVFDQRGYPTQLAANRQVGAMVHGEFGGPGFDTKYVSNISHSNEFFSYQAGIFNGSFDNQAVQNSDTTNFSQKEYAGRVFAHPFRSVDFEPIQRLGIGFAGNYTDWNQVQGLANAPLQSMGQSNILTYSAGVTVPSTRYGNTTQTTGIFTGNGGSPTATGGAVPDPKTITISNVNTVYSGAMLNGGQYHLAPQGYWYYGPFGLMADWTLSQQELSVTQSTVATTTSQADINAQATGTLTQGTTAAPGYRAITQTVNATQPAPIANKSQTNTAWQAQVSYVLTGEENTYWQIKPTKAFDPFNGNWGAWQVAFRWTELNIDQSTFTNYGSAANPLYLFADPRASVSHAQTWGLSANWFLNSNVKLQQSYDSTSFTGGAVTPTGQVANRPNENVFWSRVQIWY